MVQQLRHDKEDFIDDNRKWRRESVVGLVARVRIVGVLRSYFIFVLAKIRKSGLINVRWFLRVFIIENSSIVVLSFL